MPESFAGIAVPEGEPGGLRAAAAEYSAAAAAVDGSAAGISALPGEIGSWQGPASARFASACQEHAAAARAGVSALTTAGQVAARYAEALDTAQRAARRAIDEARDAARRIRDLERAIEQAEAREAEANDRAAAAAASLDVSAATGVPDVAAEADMTAARSAAAEAVADQEALRRRLEEAREDLRRAQQDGRQAEEDAQQAGQAAASGFGALGESVSFVGTPADAAAAHVGAGGVPPMYPPTRPTAGPMSDAASGDGYRTHGDPLRFHRAFQQQEAARRAAEERAKEDDGSFGLGDMVHGGLDVVGLVPVLGEPADLLNAGLYAAEGDHVNAGLSAAGALPFVGTVATGAKWSKRALDGADAIADATRAAPSPPVSYARPSRFRAGVREQVWENAREPSTGQVRDPVTGRFMNPGQPWDMGHQPGSEFRKHAESAQRRGIPREQFLDEHNDPSHYRPELPESNRSHRGEDLTDSYLGP
jgi:hypothetical protein